MPVWLTAALFLGCTSDGGPTVAADGGSETGSDGGGADGPGALRIGACDALDVRTLDLSSLAEADSTLDELPALGLTIARPHRPAGHAFALNLVLPEGAESPDFSLTDAVVEALGSRSVAVMGTLLPEVDVGDVRSPPRSSLSPDELDRWDVFVEAIVERYDADGVDDMPGLLLPAAAWEVFNEPRCEDAECRQELTESILRTQGAARRADPTVPVLPGGLLPLLLSEDVVNDDVAEQLAAFEAGGEDEFVNLHMLVGEAEPGLAAHVAAARELLGSLRTVWVTELGTRSPDGTQEVSDDPLVEASWLVDQWRAARDAGVHTVLWCKADSSYGSVPEVEAAAREFIFGG